MSPVIPTPRLETEAARALVGVWLIVVSLVGAQPIYRWLALQLPDYPVLSLASALALAAIACTGLGLLAMAAFRMVMTLIAPPAPSRLTVQ